MKDAFKIADVVALGDMVRLRGRAIQQVSVGSELYLGPVGGDTLLVAVEKISTYGRSTEVLGVMWTGELMVRRLEGRPMDEFVGTVARLIGPAESVAGPLGDDH